MADLNSLVVEQAAPLAPPSEHAATQPSSDDIIDLDAGDSLLENKPDDGQDSAGGEDVEAAPEVEESTEEEGQENREADEDDADLAALREPEKPAKLSGSARLKAKLAEAQAEIERLRQAVPRVDDAGALAQAIEAEIGPAPKETDYQDYLAFERAMTVYETTKALVTREIKKNASDAQARIAQHNQALVDTFKERADTLRQSIKDFDAVTSSATVSPAHTETVMLILESEKGPHIAYYLSKHPEKVHELNAMTPRQQAKEIGRLEARLTPAPPKQTKAPPPVPALKGGTAITAKDPEKMSMGEFAKWFDARKSAME